MLLFIWARPPLFLLGPAHTRPRSTRTPLSLSLCPAARQALLVSVTAAPALLPRPTRQPHPSPSIRPAARARHTSRAPAGFGLLPIGCRSPVGRDPPVRAPLPPRVDHVARPPPPPCLTRPLSKRSRTTPQRLSPLFPSSVLTPSNP
jgi:hypothetical protein